MFKFIKQAFIPLLSFSGSSTSIVNVSDRTKCIFLNNEPCFPRPIFIDLNSNELHLIHLWLV